MDAKGESSLPGNWGKKLGAFHSLEIPFFLGTNTQYANPLTAPVYSSRNREERNVLSSVIMKYVQNFVLTGNPNPPDSSLPLWQPWLTQPGSLNFNAHSTATRNNGRLQRTATPDVKMVNTVLREENIMQEMKEKLSPEIYQAVKEYFKNSPSMSH